MHIIVKIIMVMINKMTTQKEIIERHFFEISKTCVPYNEDVSLEEYYAIPTPEDKKVSLTEFINRINADIRDLGIKTLRRERNKRLIETDWTQTNDIRLENEEEWAAYRQALRDLPSFETPIWPDPPQVKIVQGKNTRTELSDTKTELKADLSDTKVELKADLQTTQTELTEERTLHETTRAQLRTTQTELDVAKIKLLNIEARMQIIESNISKVVV